MRKSRKQKLENQARRQSNLRKLSREKRRPNRDDLARVLLWQMITAAKGRLRPEKALSKVCDSLLTELVQQGFSEHETEQVFWELAKKYDPALSPFRPKRHLGV
ncbi:hypothetical protein IP85_13790 [Rhizobium sp. AAP116]|nr:hypothetical protein IP85_13790 [Rhizobium sp. AAP116]